MKRLFSSAILVTSAIVLGSCRVVPSDEPIDPALSNDESFQSSLAVVGRVLGVSYTRQSQFLDQGVATVQVESSSSAALDHGPLEIRFLSLPKSVLAKGAPRYAPVGSERVLFFLIREGRSWRSLQELKATKFLVCGGSQELKSSAASNRSLFVAKALLGTETGLDEDCAGRVIQHHVPYALSLAGPFSTASVLESLWAAHGTKAIGVQACQSLVDLFPGISTCAERIVAESNDRTLLQKDLSGAALLKEDLRRFPDVVIFARRSNSDRISFALEYAQIYAEAHDPAIRETTLKILSRAGVRLHQ